MGKKDGNFNASNIILASAHERRQRLREIDYKTQVEKDYNIELEKHLVDRMDTCLICVGSAILEPDVREQFEDAFNYMVRTCLDIGFQFVEEDLT